jgi:hypothetical protein
MWARFISALLGGWLMAAPDVLGYSGVAAAANSDHAVGPIVVGASLVAVWRVMRPLRWVELLAGAWLIVAPWVLMRWYGWIPTLDSLGVGIALVVPAFLGGKTEKSFGGGWLMLLQEERQRERP